MTFLYSVDQDTATPTKYTAGPWGNDLQHGGAPTALISWAAERLVPREPMQVVRITVDLLRPVPIAPLKIRAEVVREGRKIQLCAVTLLHEDVVVVRATVLKIRRVERPLFAGQAPTPLQRAAMIADFCNGVSTVLEFRSWTFINGDLTISLARLPVGDWILLDAQSWLGDHGAGIAFAKLGDSRGYFGRAIQSLVIEPRAGKSG